ncbi:MAG: hypothetical protein LBF16_06145 [Pseudomonadales bacterium]|jgi:uncharacterized DUF497 family protein|nr:hypothetical protein [Pseudomonadales bacterium]
MIVRLAYRQSKIAKRGLSFERVVEFDFETATIKEDLRRAISFRKANKREVRHYEQETQS